MELALSNLLANALRYARHNVSIEVARENGLCRLVVEDDGEGIPEAHRASVFHAFTRLDTSRNRETGGFGLGLAIVARIATLHRGRATADSSASLGGARLDAGVAGALVRARSSRRAAPARGSSWSVGRVIETRAVHADTAIRRPRRPASRSLGSGRRTPCAVVRIRGARLERASRFVRAPCRKVDRPWRSRRPHGRSGRTGCRPRRHARISVARPRTAAGAESAAWLLSRSGQRHRRRVLSAVQCRQRRGRCRIETERTVKPLGTSVLRSARAAATSCRGARALDGK